MTPATEPDRLERKSSSSPPPTKRRKLPIAIICLATVVVVIFLARNRYAHAARGESVEVPTVAAVRLKREAIAQQLVIDSELRPYQEVDLHAKVSGYVQSINVDIGDHVKEGQLIATLELPEAQSDLDRAFASQHRAEEEIRRAEADYAEAKLVYDRLHTVDKARPNLIAQQDIDAADSREKTASANLAAAREQAKAAEADVKKLKTMFNYARIIAPFDGVVTERFADKGALIQAGTSSSTQSMPLVRLSENNLLRLIFPVSISGVTSVHNGKPVKVEIPALNRKVNTTITRSAQKILTTTRTMDAEVDITNADYSLIPGMYASVHMDIDEHTNVVAIPVEAVSHKAIPTIYVINKDNIVEERKVKLGIEAPDSVEALDGVHEGELVMVGGRGQVRPGQRVQPKILETANTLVND